MLQCRVLPRVGWRWLPCDSLGTPDTFAAAACCSSIACSSFVGSSSSCPSFLLATSFPAPTASLLLGAASCCRGRSGSFATCRRRTSFFGASFSSALGGGGSREFVLHFVLLLLFLSWESLRRLKRVAASPHTRTSLQIIANRCHIGMGSIIISSIGIHRSLPKPQIGAGLLQGGSIGDRLLLPWGRTSGAFGHN
jgi:hypothetical protein